MPISTPDLTTCRCFKDDRPKIQRLGVKLSSSGRSKFHQEHVIHRALEALDRELSGKSIRHQPKSADA